ncbi:hypothetical protein GLAREA_10718 [Glarea lozoyensis ATCC 20868]|uniref:Uncharacterized protein n=1 Tax=Glarea lozoyensis (strain ATCC 20868 / MF5171) TaxID=1116229 RepID=S3E9M8_GLAL2|nr:uncharacterized protein GLAREA_10718 [Glarea lozoyensis ATCC 20868]EPE35023.1 hypothetical protein GLAREA_10718 [Glarea lozoyensis ATCC 20868]
MYATLAMGSKSQSHKKVDTKRPWVMKVYYTNTKVLFTVCLLNEMFFISLYLLSFSSRRLMPILVDTGGDIHSLQDGAALDLQSIWTTPWSAGAMEMARSNKIDSRVPWVALCISSVFMLFKQYVNVIQLVEASKWLAEGDARRRKTSTGFARLTVK